MMRSENSPALIVTHSHWFGDALQAVVRAALQVEHVNKTSDVSSALKIITEHHPVLVLLDVDLSDDESWSVLQQIKAQWPQTQCLVLANNEQQGQTADQAGADAVLVKGFAMDTFLKTLQQLLAQTDLVPERQRAWGIRYTQKGSNHNGHHKNSGS